MDSNQAGLRLRIRGARRRGGSAFLAFAPRGRRPARVFRFPVAHITTLDWRAQAISVTLGAFSYAAAVRLSGGLAAEDLILRLVGLLLVAMLGEYISREQRETSLQNVRLYAETRRGGEELRNVLNRFGRALASSLDVDKTMQLVADLAIEMAGASAGLLVLLDQGSKSSIAVGSGERQTELAALHRKASDWLLASILRDRAPIQIPDLAADPRFGDLATPAAGGLRSYLAVPVFLRGRVVGLLAVARSEARAVPAAKVELIVSFDNQAAVAIENARLFAAVQERLRELSGLHEISLAFASLTKLEDTYGQLVERIGRLLDVERCVILLPDDEGRYLVAQAPAYGLSEEQVRTMRIPIGETSAAARVWLGGRPYLTNDAQNDPRNLHSWALAFGDRSLVIVPMRVEGKTVGLLRASNKRGNRFQPGERS